MSLEAMKWALKEAPLGKNGGQCRNRLVLVSLADRYNDDTRVCWPSVGTIARDLGISMPTVRKALGQLEELGLIHRASPHWVQHIPANVRPIVWTLDLSKKKPVEPVAPKDMNGTADALSDKHGFTPPENDRNTGLRQADNKGLQQGSNRGLQQDRNTGLHKTKENPNENPKVNPKTNDHPADDRFIEFWESVPRKVGKGAARKAWAKAVKKADPQVIIDGMRRYRDDPNRSEEFTAHPSTWLNAERWEDDPLPARGGNRRSGGSSFLEFAPSQSNAANAPYFGSNGHKIAPGGTSSDMRGIEPPMPPETLDFGDMR